MPSSYLFDTNALIYLVYSGSPFHDEVSEFLKNCLKRDGRIYILTSSLNEIYYVLHSNYVSEEKARRSLDYIVEIFDLIDLVAMLVIQAIESDEPDYEDALVRAAAEAIQVDAIISYDKKAFKNSPILKKTAAQISL